MAKQQKDNSGVLFINHIRKTDKHPSLKGSCRIDGFDYWISGWTRYLDNDEKYLSLAFQPKEREGIQKKIDKDVAEGGRSP
jgi:hypothetical protein